MNNQSKIKKDKKKILKQLLSSAFFILILFVSLYVVDDIFVYSYNNSWFIDQRVDQLDSFEKGEIDALYVGGSRASVGFAPTVIWNETGIKGVNISTNSQPPIVTKYLTKKYVDELEPEYVFLNPASLLQEGSISSRKINNYMNGLQFFGNFFEVKQVLDELVEDYPEDDITQFLFPLYRDHTRWNVITENDFVKADYDDYLLGFINNVTIERDNVSTNDKKGYSSYNNDFEINQTSYDKYQELIDYLLEKDVKVFIVYLPDLDSTATRASGFKAIADNNNLPFLDYSIQHTFSQIEFEEKGDFYDHAHMSLTGAYKFSQLFGQQLREEYNINLEKEAKFSQYYRDFEEHFESRRELYEVYYESE